MAKDEQQILDDVTSSDYKYGFTSDIETDYAPIGLTEDTVRFISAKKEEPQWLLEYRLKAFKKWLTLKQPDWAHLKIPPSIFKILFIMQLPRRKNSLRAWMK